MSNEELAARIKAGERDRLLELWAQVRELIAWYAVRRYNAAPGLGGVEVDDLIQAGFIAMVEAVDSFDPGAGYKFSTWLKLTLRTAFAEAGGYRSKRQKMDPLHRCDSLDRPLDDEGGATLGELQAAPDCFDDTERQIWREQLRAVLDKALEDLPADWREILERRYYRGQSQQVVAEGMRVKKTDIQGREKKALHRLHHDRRRNHLDQFWVEQAIDLKTPWFLHVGPEAFASTGTSAVEKLVLQRERDLERPERLAEYMEAGQNNIERDGAALTVRAGAQA